VRDIRRESNLTITIRDDQVSGVLGYGDRPVPDRVQAILREIKTEAVRVVRPACTMLRASPDLLTRSTFLNQLDDAVFCLVTIGDGVEKAMEAYDHAGEIGKALIMNVFGSVATEAAADAANALIRDDITGEGLRCTRRFSPGYGGWDLSEQCWILPVLDAEALGVTLTDGCMMVPRKSISFAVNVGENPVEMRDDNECEACELVNCAYRRKTVINEENGRQWKTFIGPDSNYCPLDRWS